MMKAVTENKGSPDERSRGDITSFVNTTPRVRGAHTVTSFQNTSVEDPASHRLQNKTEEDFESSELDGSAFLSESTDKA